MTQKFTVNKYDIQLKCYFMYIRKKTAMTVCLLD